MREMTATQFREMEAFHALEPFGFEVENLRLASLEATVANMAGKSLPRGKVVRPSEMGLRLRKRMSREEQRAETVAQFKMLVAAVKEAKKRKLAKAAKRAAKRAAPPAPATEPGMRPGFSKGRPARTKGRR